MLYLTVAERRFFHLFMKHELRDLPVSHASYKLSIKGESLLDTRHVSYLRNFNRHTYLIIYIRVRKTSGCKILSPKETWCSRLLQLFLNVAILCVGTGGFGLQRQEWGFTTLCRTSRTRLQLSGLKIFGAPWGYNPVYMCVLPHVVL